MLLIFLIIHAHQPYQNIKMQFNINHAFLSQTIMYKILISRVIIIHIKLIRHLVVRYKTDDNKQSMCNLASLVLGMVSSLLSLPLKHSTWNWFKLSIASVLGFVGIFLDALTYHHHINVTNFMINVTLLCQNALWLSEN